MTSTCDNVLQILTVNATESIVPDLCHQFIVFE